MSQYLPLSKRVYRSTSCTQRVASVSQFRPSTYKNWSKESMELAYQAVMNDGISVRRAAIEYNVPRSTLGDRVRGSVLPGAVSGNQPYLSSSEEDELVQFLLRCADIGYPRGRKEVIAIVQRHCNSQGLDVQVTHGWWERFCLHCH